MIPLQLDLASERRLRNLATVSGRDAPELVRQIVGDYLDAQAWEPDAPETWAEASSLWPQRFCPTKPGTMERVTMDRGDVWWADLPAPIGRRPVLILTRSAAIPVRNQVVVAQVTRTVHGIQSEVALTRSDGMPRDCVINCDVLLTVPKTRLDRRITQLAPSKMDEVHQALRFAI